MEFLVFCKGQNILEAANKSDEIRIQEAEDAAKECSLEAQRVRC